MQFVILFKFRGKPTSKEFADSKKIAAEAAKKGVKIQMQYWTLGRFDSLWVVEAKSEKQAMKYLLSGRRTLERISLKRISSKSDDLPVMTP